MPTEREIDEAMETASRCRLLSSQVRQLGLFDAYADWLRDNAKGAERWAVKAAKELRLPNASERTQAEEPVTRKE